LKIEVKKKIDVILDCRKLHSATETREGPRKRSLAKQFFRARANSPLFTLLQSQLRRCCARDEAADCELREIDAVRMRVPW
jgi:hypothetical protein